MTHSVFKLSLTVLPSPTIISQIAIKTEKLFLRSQIVILKGWRSIAHSVLKLVIGFAKAALMARCATVSQAINMELPMASKNMEALSGIWYA